MNIKSKFKNYYKRLFRVFSFSKTVVASCLTCIILYLLDLLDFLKVNFQNYKYLYFIVGLAIIIIIIFNFKKVSIVFHKEINVFDCFLHYSICSLVFNLIGYIPIFDKATWLHSLDIRIYLFFLIISIILVMYRIIYCNSKKI